MAEKHLHRQVQLEYQYDRLAYQKLSQVYRMLVMDNILPFDGMVTHEINSGDQANEDRGHLRQSIFRQAKTGTNDR